MANSSTNITSHPCNFGPPMMNPHSPHPMQVQAQVQVQAPLQSSYQIPGYHDYANVQFEMEEGSQSLQAQTLLLATSFHLANHCKSSDLVFPQKLHMLLTAAEQDKELESIVSWKVHGRAFAVHDRKRFLREVLPEWFLQSRFESFQRQLNLYGFRRITTGPDRGSCYHELFLRQKPLLAARILRLRLKGKGPRQPAKPELEPNFYRMSLLPTYATVKNQTSYAMRYPYAAPPPRQAFAPPQLAQSASPPPVLVPKPSARPAATANPNGLCALMMRPLAYAQAVSAPAPILPKQQPIAAKSNDIISAKPISSKPSLVSAPPSPVIRYTPAQAVAPVYQSFPMAMAPAFPMNLSAPRPQQSFEPSWLPTVLQPKPPPAAAEAPTPALEAPVPRCVSLATLTTVEKQQWSISHAPATDSNNIYQTNNTALALELPTEETSDDDFALILAELASS